MAIEYPAQKPQQLICTNSSSDSNARSSGVLAGIRAAIPSVPILTAAYSLLTTPTISAMGSPEFQVSDSQVEVVRQGNAVSFIGSGFGLPPPGLKWVIEESADLNSYSPAVELRSDGTHTVTSPGWSCQSTHGAYYMIGTSAPTGRKFARIAEKAVFPSAPLGTEPAPADPPSEEHPAKLPVTYDIALPPRETPL